MDDACVRCSSCPRSLLKRENDASTRVKSLKDFEVAFMIRICSFTTRNLRIYEFAHSRRDFKDL